MNVDVFQVPYHGRQRKGIGNGPDSVVEADIVTRHTDCGHEVNVERVERDGPFTHEIGASMDLNIALSGGIVYIMVNG